MYCRYSGVRRAKMASHHSKVEQILGHELLGEPTRAKMPLQPLALHSTRRWMNPSGREDVIKVVLCIYMFVSRMFWKIGENYERICNKLEAIRGKAVRPSRRQAEDEGDERRRHLPPDSNDQPEAFPKLPLALQFYGRFLTCWMVYSLTRSCFANIYLFLLDKINFTSFPGHCLLLGKFVLNIEGERFAATLFCGLHLTWRFTQYITNRPYHLTFIFFLLHDRRQASRFEERFFSRTGEGQQQDGHALQANGGAAPSGRHNRGLASSCQSGTCSSERPCATNTSKQSDAGAGSTGVFGSRSGQAEPERPERERERLSEPPSTWASSSYSRSSCQPASWSSF